MCLEHGCALRLQNVCDEVQLRYDGMQLVNMDIIARGQTQIVYIEFVDYSNELANHYVGVDYLKRGAPACLFQRSRYL